MINARPRALSLVPFLLLGMVALGRSQVDAQSRDSLQARLALPAMPGGRPAAAPARQAPQAVVYTDSIYPGLTLLSPHAMNAEGWTVFVGAAFQERARFVEDSDGAVYAGLGVGDAVKYVGFAVTVVGFSTIRSGFGDRVGFGAQVNRFIGTTAVAVGVENFAMVDRHDESDADLSVYGVATHIFKLHDNPNRPFSFLGATLGVGSGRFRSEDDVFEDDNTVGVFAAVSVSAIRAVSFIADWYGQDLALGVSLAPFSNVPLVITPGFFDVTRNAGDGTRFAIAATIGHRFTRGPLQF